MKTLALAIAVMAMTLGGCASMRKVQVGSEQGTAYRLDVYNARSGSVVVSYSDGANTRELGTVSAGRTEHFVVASPSTTTITVLSRTTGGTALTSRTVTLQAGGTATVTIR